MRSKVLSKRVLLIAIPLVVILLVVLLLNFIPNNSTQDNSTTIIEDTSTRVDLPARLKIPKLNVSAPVEYVGITPLGAMDIPKNPNEVAWFNLGARPGEIGSAVVSGHYGWKDNIPAVFDNLHKLKVGDEITIEDEKGVVTTFVVREMRIYDKDTLAPEVFASSDGKAHLNLVTCTGDWIKEGDTYSNRLVVFSEKL